MIMTVDVCNSKIVFGVYKDDELRFKWKIKTDKNKSIEEYKATIVNLVSANRISKVDIKGISMLSVVPELTVKIKKALKALSRKIIVLGKDPLKTGVKVKIDNPGQAIEDILAKSIAGKHKFKKDFIIVDFGTVTTFQISDSNGDFIGASIAPGMKKSFFGLCDSSSRIPEIDINSINTKKAIGKNTIDAVKSGIYFGYMGGIKEIISRMKEEYGKEDMKICFTGGLSNVFENEKNFADVIDPNLTLYGLKLLWDMNK